MKQIIIFLLLLIPYLSSAQTVAVYINGSATSIGGVSPWVTKSSSDTLAVTQTKVKVNAAQGNINITLPSPASCVGVDFIIKKTDSSSHTVTLVGLIDGIANYVIYTQNESIILSSDGISFLIL